MSALDRVVPQASQPHLFNRLVEQVVQGEQDLDWLRHKLGFKNARNVHYYLEAARWARLIDESAVLPTSLGCRFVASRFDPRVALEGLRGRAFFEEVLRVAGGAVPDREMVEGILRRWSFRYSKGTVTRRAHDFCRLYGSMISAARNPEVERLVVASAWVEPAGLLAIEGVGLLAPRLHLSADLRRLGGRRSEPASSQLALPWEDGA